MALGPCIGETSLYKENGRGKLLTGAVDLTDYFFPASLPMDCIHRFHLRSGVILRCQRCSKHGDLLRGSPFIGSGENSGSDREGETILAWFVRYWKLEANFFASTVKF